MHRRALPILLLGLVFASRCLAVHLGMDRAELVKELGPPVSHAAVGAREILLYPNNVRIELEEGKVTQVQGLSLDAKPQAVYLGMDRVELVQSLGPPVSHAVMGAHEILLYPNDVRVELQDGKVVDVQGMTVGAGPSASSPGQNAPVTPPASKPAPSEGDKASQAEVESEPPAYAAQAKERAKLEDAVMQMEKTHDAPRETAGPGIDPARLMMELFLRWVVILLALKLTCMFWGVTVEWPGLMLVAMADAVTRMILHVAAIHFLNVSSLFGVENIIAAIVMIIVLMKVSINRSWKQAVQLTVTSKTFAIVVWAVGITAMLRQFG